MTLASLTHSPQCALGVSPVQTGGGLDLKVAEIPTQIKRGKTDSVSHFVWVL